MPLVSATSRKLSRTTLGLFAGLLSPALCLAQSSPELQQILQRLEHLEEQNRELVEEVRALRAQLSAAPPEAAKAEPPAALEERLEVQERRTDELAQTKVEASQRFPIRITGMALFNTYLNSKQSGGAEYPTVATPGTPASGGATLRQTILGLEYQGPQTFLGGTVKGSLYMDFFAGGGGFNSLLHIRTGSIELDWATRSLRAGVEKPIFNPREPTSLAQVGISPLTGAGNLWLWIPQVRFEQDFRFGGSSGLRAQFGAVQTSESQPYQATSYVADLEPTRPGLEGRFEFFHRLDDIRRFEFATGFHESVSHVADTSVPSRVLSFDWFANPWRRLEFTGVSYTGQNVASLGTGGIRQGVTALGPGIARPVHNQGGWAQLTFLATPRLSFNLFSGLHDDRNSDLMRGRISNNLAYGGNFLYHLAPNVIFSMEASQLRTSYIGASLVRNNHYDLALAYLF
jgi:hypothetical protein